MAAQTPPRLPEQHQATQARIAAEVAPLMDRAWSVLDTANLDATLPRFTAVVSAIVDRLGSAAASASNVFYRAARKGLPGDMPQVKRSPATELEVDQMVVAAVTSRMSGDTETADRVLDSEAEQLVQDQARRQVMSTAQLDREARGWARVVEPGACSFCLMLAMRGAIYDSKSTANFRAHKKKPNGSGGDCRCQAEPVFGKWEPQASVRDAKKLWDDVTKGRTGHDARTAFRQALEGRTVTGAKSKGKGGRSTPNPVGKDRHGTPYVPVTKEWTKEGARHQLEVLLAMPPAKTPEAAKWRADRIAEMRKLIGE